MESPAATSDYLSPRPGPVEPHRAPSRLPLLLFVLLTILVLAFVPALMERIQYRRTLGEVQALRETLPQMNLKALGKAFSMIYRAVKPSVVHIDTTRPVSVNERGFNFFGQNPGYEALGQASGVIVDTGGFIITNLHVIANADSISVQLDDHRSFDAKVIGVDPGIDLAVLKIKADGLTAAAWGDSDQLEVGEMVWAIGNPFGLDQTITSGIVSAKGRLGVGQSIYQEFLQTDVAINPGNSGGPLVDINGDIVGINTAIVGRGYQGISFAIPSNLAREVYDKIRKDGKVIRGYLGVELDAPNRNDIQRLGLPLDRPVGAIVRKVTPDSPASRAKLQRGDVIVQWNGQPVTDFRELTIVIAHTPVGQKVPLKVIRDGKEVDLEAEIVAKAPMS